jgi:hypothetical protein
MIGAAPFGFAELDELAFAAVYSGKAQQLPGEFLAANLGTLIELQWLLNAGLPLPSLGELVLSQRVILVEEICSGELISSFENDLTRCRLIRLYWGTEDDPDDWYGFCSSLQNAAGLAGLPPKNAQELVAATRELVSNVFEHSDASSSGLAGFCVNGSGLEIVVADRGIGVLESLRSAPEFSSLRDSGEALETALTDGNSRFGRGSGNGGGFRNLFRGLFNLSSALRFRSGDHALTIDGISPGLGTARISQKVSLQGFVISISCT